MAAAISSSGRPRGQIVALTLAPMTAHDLDQFIREEIEDCMEAHVRDGSWSRCDSHAREQAQQELATVTARERQATTSEHQRLWTALTPGGQCVGWLWVKLPTPGRWEGSAFLCQMTVRRDCRRQGYGRAMLAALEDRLARDGATELRLNVWEENEPAKSLYAEAGYELAHQYETMRQLRKALPAPEQAEATAPGTS